MEEELEMDESAYEMYHQAQTSKKIIENNNILTDL